MRYRCVLVIGTNKPELPGIYLEIKRSHATGLVGHCSQKCSSDWAETVAILRHIPQDPSSLAKTVVPVRWTWFAFIANTVQIRLHRVITEIHFSVHLSDADHQSACPNELLPFPRSRKWQSDPDGKFHSDSHSIKTISFRSLTYSTQEQ